MATRLYIKENTLIKQLNNDNGFVVDAHNVKFNDAMSVFDKINSLSSFSPTLDGSGEKLLWLGGSISPTTITSGNTGTLNKGQILAKYTDNYYKDITSSVVFSVSDGSISGTSITPPTLNSGTQIITLTASYTEGSITQTAKKTYTAKAAQQTTYTISWNGNGATSQASGGSLTVTQGSSVTLPTTNPKREYNITWNNNSGSGNNGGSEKAIYTFNNWWTLANGGTQVTSSTIPTGNVTYYAHWTDPSSITLPTTNPTCEGYTFQGWATTNTATTPDVSSNTKPTANVTYYAVWKINTYTVDWNANGGTGTISGGSSSVEYNQAVMLPTTNPTREGYTFQGWATTNNATTPDVSSSTKPNANVTYYAVWAQTAIYYWYVGTTKPTASTNPESDLTTSTGNVQTTLGWIKLTSTPSEVHPYNDPGDFVDRTWWVAIPTEYNFQAYNTAGSAPDNDAWPHNETVTIGGVQYTLFHSANPKDSINVVLKP